MAFLNISYLSCASNENRLDFYFCFFQLAKIASSSVSKATVSWLVFAETLEPEVKILSLAIKSPGRPDIVLTIPENGNPKGSWFTLKEGSRYSLLFTFQVSNNIVSGLKYTNTVWKTGVRGYNLSLSPPLSLIDLAL